MDDNVVLIVLNAFTFLLFLISETLAYTDSPYNGIFQSLYKKWLEFSLSK